MDSLFFHPKIVHLPMALGVLMPLIAGGLWLAWWRGWLPSRAWWLAVGLQGALVATSFLALRTGEAEEERVEAVVSENLIEAHEEAAEVFTWGAVGVLGVMVLASVLAARPGGTLVGAVATVGTLVVLGLGYRTGQAGGDLVYRHGAAQAYVDAGKAPGVAASAHEGEQAEDAEDERGD